MEHAEDNFTTKRRALRPHPRALKRVAVPGVRRPYNLQSSAQGPQDDSPSSLLRPVIFVVASEDSRRQEREHRPLGVPAFCSCVPVSCGPL